MEQHMKSISDYHVIKINKPHGNQVIMIQKQVSFGAGTLASNGTPPLITPDAKME